MIRVNLMRNRVQEGTQATSQAPMADPASAGAANTKDSLIKLGLMALFVAGLMLYESQNISTLNQERNRLQAQVSALETEAQAKAAEIEGIKDIVKQAQELEDKLKALNLLSKLRLREVKTLDFMQTSIPEKVWLREVIYGNDKTRPSGGRYQFQGNAVSTEDLTEFVRRLENSAYLSDVIIIKNQETNAGPRQASLRNFTFTAEVESAP
ncbi:MAG TPA: PilN domain-containing protein [Bdellovibrionales bacterium]|nr:PilN domain-containing protein [Bdellovibrionales bacterium]